LARSQNLEVVAQDTENKNHPVMLVRKGQIRGQASSRYFHKAPNGIVAPMQQCLLFSVFAVSA
jgi:hypothetical protein